MFKTDNGGEFCENEFDEFFKKCSIDMKNTNPYTPQQNGVAKRVNRTLMEKERSMLRSVGIGQEFWAEVVETSCYWVNQSPTLTLVDNSPQEVWTGKKPSIKHMQVFGCDDYVHVPKDK